MSPIALNHHHEGNLVYYESTSNAKRETPKQTEESIPNFRHAGGMTNVYRCGAPDGMVDALLAKSDNELTQAERVILYDVTLIVDLRSNSVRERNEERVMRLYENAPGGRLEVIKDETAFLSGEDGLGSERQVFRVDILTQTLARMGHSGSPSDNETKVVMVELMKSVQERGLVVIYELMLEKGAPELCLALKAITVHLEKVPHGQVVIHCTQGKDRTGVLVMLLQALLCLSEDEIAADFAKSTNEFSEAATQVAKDIPGMNHVGLNALRSSDPQAIIGALHYIDQQNGSVSNYFDAISFDEAWRQRLLLCLVVT